MGCMVISPKQNRLVICTGDGVKAPSQFQETDTYQIHLGNKILQKNEKFKKNIQIILYIHFKQEVATWI